MALLNDAGAVYLGAAGAERAYLGSALVWEQDSGGLEPPSGLTATSSSPLPAPTDVQSYNVGGGV